MTVEENDNDDLKCQKEKEKTTMTTKKTKVNQTEYQQKAVQNYDWLL